MKSSFTDFPKNKFDPVMICGKDWCGKGSCNKNVEEAKVSAFRNLVMLCLDIMISKKSEVKTSVAMYLMHTTTATGLYRYFIRE